MTDAHVGRLLVAAVHQAIADELPTRIDFYEHWLGGDRLRDGGVGLAPMTAVIGFLRAEGDAYHSVMATAGRFAADWTRDAMPAVRRRYLGALPRWWRSRAVLAVASRAIREGYASSRVVVRVRRGHARIEIKQSLFCRVRERQTVPQCDFYTALIARLLSGFDLTASSSVESCSAMGGERSCVVVVNMQAAGEAAS
jgi:hypothetical protein